MSKKIYIAGKVTGLPKNEVIEKFATAQKQVEALGYTAVNPIEVVGDFSATWEGAMKKCLKALIDCDAVLLLPCWQDSKGATIERQLADDLEIVIFNSNKLGLKVMKAVLS